MARYLVDFEITFKLVCTKKIKAESWDDAQAIANKMKYDIPLWEYYAAKIFKRTARVTERIMFSDNY